MHGRRQQPDEGKKLLLPSEGARLVKIVAVATLRAQAFFGLALLCYGQLDIQNIGFVLEDNTFLLLFNPL